jgi:zinc/manganese transport system substrate-binding protein/manganese/iron transport system substrate-binding protein
VTLAGLVAVAVAVGVVFAACGPGPVATPGAGTPLRVVATTTVFADLVRQIGGSAVDVRSLVPKGGEVHTFDPTPADVGRVAAAGLIVVNGLGLDDWLTALARDAGTAAPIVRLGENLPGASYLAGDDGAAGNPHLWLDVTYAIGYVDRIQAALEAADPTQAAAFRAAATAYKARLMALDGDIRARLGSLPAADRNVVSFHDAFPYFARAYGLTIVGSVVASPGQDPSAGSIADLVAAVRANGVHLILAEAQFSPKLAATIAGETGATVVTDLYTDSVGDAPADTYEGMMRSNLERILGALPGG